MGTRAVVAVPYAGTWRGRYVHWSGQPEHTRAALYRIVVRDGLDRAAEVLTAEHYGWSSITGQDDPQLLDSQRDGRFTAVPGYGVAYTPANDVDASSWIGPDDLAAEWIEWIYVLTPDGIATWSAAPDGALTVHRG